jgi:GNAT superfamily N-acetyltransferase
MEIIETGFTRMDEYASIPISFEVSTIFEIEVIQSGLGGIRLVERPVAQHIKDYDELGSPLQWAYEFDIQNWGIFMAMEAGKPAGGAALAWNTNGVDMLEDRRDLAVLWDIRVLPALRGTGIGKMLFDYAADWSKSRGCVQMKVETQNINVAACRFYAAMGAQLGDIRRFAYSTQPPVMHEVQLNWYLALEK